MTVHLQHTCPRILAGRLHHNVDEELVRHTSAAVLGLHFQDEVVLHRVIQRFSVPQNSYATHDNDTKKVSILLLLLLLVPSFPGQPGLAGTRKIKPVWI